MKSRAMHRSRTLFSLLLAVVFCACIFAPLATAHAAPPVSLDGNTINTTGPDNAGISYSNTDDFIIDLNGKDTTIDVRNIQGSCGIKAGNARIIIRGIGSLHIFADKNGIDCKELMIESGTVTVEQTYAEANAPGETAGLLSLQDVEARKVDYAAVKTSGNITINGGSLTATAQTGHGILCVGNMIMTNGTIVANGGKFGDGVHTEGFLEVDGGVLKGYAGGAITFQDPSPWVWPADYLPMPYGAGIETGNQPGSYIAVTGNGKLYGKTGNKLYTRAETHGSVLSSYNMAIATYQSQLFGGYVNIPSGGEMKPISKLGIYYAGVFDPNMHGGQGQYVTEAEIVGTVGFIPGSNSENQSWSGGAMTFRAYPEDTQFDGNAQVKIDGQVVSPSNYAKSSGSTIITLDPAYLATLPGGAHNIEIVFGGHFAGKDRNAATTQFYIGGAGLNAPAEAAAVPQTGDNSPLLLLAGCFLLAGVVLILRRRKRA